VAETTSSPIAERDGAGEASAARLSIGALSRATGIPVETLRTWEARYGFPEPVRKPSGHRVYLAATVQRLRRVAAAIAKGHRPCECVAATEVELATLLEASAPSVRKPLEVPEEGLEALISAVVAFDADRLTRMLLGEWSRLGPVDFLARCAIPLVGHVGDEWSAGRLQIHHEHFLSERLGDVLRSLRLPYDDHAHGPTIVCATLPGERHALGLQMAALVAAVAGWRVVFLGTEVPAAHLAQVASTCGARAVAVSVSRLNAGPEVADGLREVRIALPGDVLLLAGGEGTPEDLPGIERITDFAELDDRLRQG
jgi:DNA-binding transcriptional MerR regulator/methylmalonyl-CoA mutase cobalamin-binding subunit